MRFTPLALGVSLIACSGDSTVPIDDASIVDVTLDTSAIDAAKKDSSVQDSSVADSSMLDASTSDADLDASMTDADDGSVLDSGDAGGCANVVCKNGLVCCNIQKSFNYGKCYNKLCLACCQ